MPLATTLQRACLLLLAFFGFGIAAAQPIRYVSTTGTNTDPASATSWATSTTDLQGAINASAANDQVWVRAGVYKPGGSANTDRTISFAMKAGVAVYGGFPTSGTPTLLQRNPRANLTTLSGEIGDLNNIADNSYHVLLNTAGLTATAVLDGFVVTAGDAQGASGTDDARGGGVLNTAYGANTVCNPQFRNCQFRNNTALAGGAMLNRETGGGTCSPTLVNCLFESNLALSGGAIANRPTTSNGACSPVLINCSFQSNEAQQGGAISNVSSSSGSFAVRVVNGSFQGNRSTVFGQAIYNNGTGGTSTLTLTNSILFGQTGSGGIIVNVGASTSASYSLFETGVLGYTDVTGNLTTSLSPFVSTTSTELVGCSPAIDAGNRAAYDGVAGPTTDLAGAARFVNSNLIDMGAYEFQGTFLPPPARLFVDVGATTGTNTGLTWTNAFTDLRSALEYSCSQNLTEIWVAQGIYQPTSGTARTASFHLLNGVTIYGGFVSGASSLSARSPAVNPTILSGEIGDPATPADNSYHVIYNPPGTTNTAVLDGFFIEGGNANGQGDEFLTTGAGVYNDGRDRNGFAGCTPVFRQCVFRNNHADDSGGGMFNNGGLLTSNRENASPTLFNCTFESNTADDGGAVYNFGSQGQSSPKFTNCLFQRNRATLRGGAIANDASSAVAGMRLINCAFIDNGANQSGGAVHNFATTGLGSPQFTNVSFRQNSSPDGGAIANLGGDPDPAKPVLTNCVVFDNGAPAISNVGNTTLVATYTLFGPQSLTTGLILSGSGNLNGTVSPFASGTFVTLQVSSIAINAGDPATTSATVGATDLAGQFRFFNNGQIDMGAVEFQGFAPPSVTAQPASASTVCEGTSVVVTVGVLGNISSYQWLRNGSPVAGQNTATLSLGNVQVSDGGVYSLSLTGPGGGTTSNSFTLAINSLPTVTLLAPNTVTVQGPGSGVATITLPPTGLPTTFQATGGITYERLIILDRTNGYEIRQVDSNTTGIFPINRLGLFTLTVTGGGGCKRTVQWVVQNP